MEGDVGQLKDLVAVHHILWEEEAALISFAGAGMGWGTGSQRGRWQGHGVGRGGFAHLSFGHFCCPDGFHQHRDGASWASDVGRSCVDGHGTAFLAEQDFSPYGHPGVGAERGDPESPLAPRAMCAHA